MNKLFTIFIAILSFTTLYAQENLQISKSFFLNDAIKSYTANKYKINNFPSSEKKKNIIYTAHRMDVIKHSLNKEINITSWYRNKTLNQKVKGAKNSQHQEGLAIDFKIVGNNSNIKKKLDKINISYDQLIYYPKQNRIHISFKSIKKEERNQYLIKS